MSFASPFRAPMASPFRSPFGVGDAPDFELNFVSGAWDPRVTHSRTSGAMQTHRDGVLDWGPENLLLQSSALASASWGKVSVSAAVPAVTSGFSAPDGTTAACKVDFPAVSGASAFSCVNQLVGQAAVAHTFSIYARGVVGGEVIYLNVSPDGVTYQRTTMTLTTSWQRFTVAFTRAAMDYYCQVGVDLRDASQTAKPAQSVYLWGARLQRGTHSYAEDDWRVQTTSAAVYHGRLHYDPVTLACLGYLNEPQRTNLLLNSATLSTQSVSVSATAYTLSFYGTGTVTLSGASTAGPLVGTGAYPTRSTLTFTPSAGSLTLTVTGSVTWAQLEAGSTATSWIPTTGTSATRAADVAYVDVATHLPWLSMTNSTFYAEFIARDYRASERVLGTNQSPASLLEIGWTNVISAFDGAASFGVTVPSALDVNLKAALALSSGSRAIAAGGVTGSAASNTMSAPTRIYIGSEAGTSRIFSGTIKSARVHSHTKPAAEMAQLTA